MINISALLDEIKASPYREIVIRTPHTGVVTFADIKEGDEVLGPQGQWKEKPGTRLAPWNANATPNPSARLKRASSARSTASSKACSWRPARP